MIGRSTTSSETGNSRSAETGGFFGLLLVLAMLCGLFGLLSDHFLTLLTLRTLLNQIPALVVIATGMTLVLVMGGIDLSVGSVAALAGATLGVAVADLGWTVAVGCGVALLVGLLCGLLNGLLVTTWALPSFIVTLGMLEVARGGAYLVTGSQTKYIGSKVAFLGRPLEGLGLSPALLAAVAVVLLAQFVLSRTVYGRYLTAVGANAEATRLSGVDPRRVRWLTFSVAGALAGLGGVFQVAYLESADPNAGIGIELAAIAAVVIGGTSLMGGRGSALNSFLGVLVIAVLQTGLAQVGASEPAKRVITGAVIVAAVVVDAYRQRMRGRGYPLLRRLLS